MNDHLSPVGKPAPPRPRSPDDFTSSIVASRPISSARAIPSYPPMAFQPATVRAAGSPNPSLRIRVSLSCLYG